MGWPRSPVALAAAAAASRGPSLARAEELKVTPRDPGRRSRARDVTAVAREDALHVAPLEVVDDEIARAGERQVETLSPQILKTIIGVLATFLLLTTGFIVFGLVRRKPVALPL